MSKRTTIIKAFLEKSARHEHLKDLFTPDIEVQVNFAQDGGDVELRTFKNRKIKDYTDGVQTWPAVLRLPRNSMSDPIDNDVEMNGFNFEEHVEAVGATGWDWRNKVSKWVGFDFDSIVGHKKEGLSPEELSSIVTSLKSIDWVTIQKSTSGNGLHIYVHLPDVPTVNHTEHAALARAVLGKMAGMSGQPLEGQVDVCGAVLWLWHRKGDKPRSFEMLKQGHCIPQKDIPQNWRDHVKVIKGTSKRTRPSYIPERQISTLEELVGQYQRLKLDPEHKKLVDYLNANECIWWWEQDMHMLVTHTQYLKEAHLALGFKGLFDTTSSGSSEHNCFLFPMRNGVWSVRRYSQGVSEHPSWDQDNSGWTRCFYNKPLSLEGAVRCFGGVEHPKGGYYFSQTELAVSAFRALGMPFDVPVQMAMRDVRVRVNAKGQISLELERENKDRGTPDGWIGEKTKYVKVVGRETHQVNDDTENYDDYIRHIYATGRDLGWCIQTEDGWREEPLQHVKTMLLGDGKKGDEVNRILGKGIACAWEIVNEPFQPEYVGDRKWNRDPAKLRFTPDNTREDLRFPHWQKILDHCGQSITSAVEKDTWCQLNDVSTGADYLKLWTASLFQQPLKQLPYLFMFGNQDSGKSSFHESLNLLLSKGYMLAERTLRKKDSFNGELAGQVLCAVEEVDLSKEKTAYDKIKSLVTDRKIAIEAKFKQVCVMPNSTHWVQCANNASYCPVFPGDTRIVVIEVPDLNPTELIPRDELIEHLEAEATDFITHVMNLEIPPSGSRLNVPVVNTDAKEVVSSYNQNPVDTFISNHCTEQVGGLIKFAQFYARFTAGLEQEERGAWSKVKVSKALKVKFPSGGLPREANKSYIGNICWNGDNIGAPDNPKAWKLRDGKLYQEI